MKASRTGTVSNDVQAFASKPGLVAPPPGFELGSAKEKFIWDGIVSCRPANAWTDVDLFLVHKVVIMQSDIERHKKALAVEGDILELTSGNIKANPRIGLINAINQQTITILSRLNVLHQPVSGGAMKNRVRKTKEASELMDSAAASGLLATADED
jgi:hypothetical protein